MLTTTKGVEPELKRCIESLLKLDDASHAQSPQIISELYVAGLGFLYMLKVDQATIRHILTRNDDTKEIPYPKPNEIPAISALLSHPKLFNVLVSTLSSNTNDGDSADPRPNQNHSSSRKRLASLDSAAEMLPSKSLKVSHSPQVSKRSMSQAKPQINFRVLAATILFLGFESLDHWPAPLVKAYAEDCFGPRSWVDDPTCSLLVENLSRCHSNDTNTNESTVDDEKRAKAVNVSEYYRNLNDVQKLTPRDHDLSYRRRGSASSSGSLQSASLQGRQRSMSVESPISISKGRSNTGSPMPSKKRKAENTTNDADSDSGDDEEMAITPSFSKGSNADGDSSSSGEEDEEVVLPSGSFTGDEAQAKKSEESSRDSSTPQQQHPLAPKNIEKFPRVRDRYFGQNLQDAHGAIAFSLGERLDLRSKQNSGLLSSLPNFLAVPEVRRLVAMNLEKWLQSPALSGLGRSLFSQTVKMMPFVDPPLPSDLDVIDNILKMRLKANQLHAHVENVTLIAKRIPTAAVSSHIFGRLLRNMLLSLDNTDSSTSDQMQMIQAVISVLPGELSAAGLGSGLMMLLVERPDSLGDVSTPAYVRRLCGLVIDIAKHVGNRFKACDLMEAIRTYDVESSNGWAAEDKENRGRLLFQCVALMLDGLRDPDKRNTSSKTQKELSPDQNLDTKAQLMRARKVLLMWCCQEYAPLFDVGKEVPQNKTSPNENVGAGPANFTSVLDGNAEGYHPRWTQVIRTFLFLENETSTFLGAFTLLEEGTPEWKDEMQRIHLCHDIGCDLDDEQVWIVLKATQSEDARLPKLFALLILEELFKGCCRDKKGSLCTTDPQLLWELYSLVEYDHRNSRHTTSIKGSDDEVGNSTDCATNEVPRLAYPGLWWRATCLGLVMCGSAPDTIGATAWDQHPTLKVLMKMVTSDRYRFPTVDCDESERDAMKKIEQTMRDDECRVTEILFFPKKADKQTKKAPKTEPIKAGARASRRQKEKRERLLKKQLEKEKHEAAKEASRRKKLLKLAQKSIMLWDPKKGPRKPPKESADLIFSIGELFDLSKIFQRNVDPDFLLQTIGGTSRGAIERAYDWLIPIISVVPETIVRLPASASCFLLLRAYGTDGDERTQLQELSAPLLQHVRRSLVGDFGETDSIRAFDLLFTDVASHNPDRRRCGRRVLHDAIGEEKTTTPVAFKASKCVWMLNIATLKYSAAVVDDVINYLSRAASFERGRVLRYLILALDFLSTSSVVQNSLSTSFDFPTVLSDLISARPTVFAATMGVFPDLRSLAIRVVQGQYEQRISQDAENKAQESFDDACSIVFCTSVSPRKDDTSSNAILPLALLETSCVILSIWTEDTDDDSEREAVTRLVRLLMTSSEESPDRVDFAHGLASAKLVATGSGAIPVESWVMLARSRSDFIAKRAALTAPNSFLPRLLMCSGLPKALLVTMIDRLGKLGEKSKEVDKLFHRLLTPSALSEWDIGRLGRRKEVTRRLLGRLFAYFQMYDLSKEEMSFTFLNWLSAAVEPSSKSKKNKGKKDVEIPPENLSSIDSVELVLSSMDEIIPGKDDKIELNGNASDMTRFLMPDRMDLLAPHFSLKMQSNVEEAFQSNRVQLVEHWLDSVLSGDSSRPPKVSGDFKLRVASLLLKSFIGLDRKSEGLGALILKWVPLLSTQQGSPDLWESIFAPAQKPRFLWHHLVSNCYQDWTPSHVLACQTWILRQNDDALLDHDRIIDFLLQSTTTSCVHSQNFGISPKGNEESSIWNVEEPVKRAIKFALESLEACAGKSLDAQLRSRNDLPKALILILLIARAGRKQVQVLSQCITERIDAEPGTRSMYLPIILRVYSYYPNQMNLGAAALRTMLTEAAGKDASEWLTWRSPLDDQFRDMIDAISIHGPVRLSQALADGSKRHPLLLMRHFGRMQLLLEKDAGSHILKQGGRSDVVVGYHIGEVPIAELEGQNVKVRIRHWGYNFTDGVWITFLDAISVIPKEVLFGCGLQMGLLDFLAVYVRLMLVQSQLRTDERPGRLKGRFAEFLTMFRTSNISEWEKWLTQKITGLESMGPSRNILMSCGFISHQEAIENIKGH